MMLCGINSANESIEVENEKRNLYQRKYGRTRIAIMEDGQLVEVYTEKQDKHRMVVYRGIVENVLPGMQAASS